MKSQQTAVTSVLSRLAFKIPEGPCLERLEAHDFANPLASIILETCYNRARITGNCVTCYDAGRTKTDHFYVLSNGQIETSAASLCSLWTESFAACGWDIETHPAAFSMHRDSPDAVRNLASRKKILLFSLVDPKSVQVEVPLMSPAGGWSIERLTLRGLPEGTAGAQKIASLIRDRQARLPGSPDAAERASIEGVRRLIRRMDPSYNGLKDVTGHGWQMISVTYQSYDQMLNAVIRNDQIGITSPLRSGGKMIADMADVNRIKSAIGTTVRREKRFERGTQYSLVARNMLGDDLRFTPNKPNVVEHDGGRTEIVYTVRDGNVGAEVTIHTSSGSKVRILNRKFEVGGVHLPEAAMASCVGKPLSTIIDHPAARGGLLITKMTCTREGIEGSFKEA